MSWRATSGRLLSLVLLSSFAAATGACELCSIYNASNATGEFNQGLLVSVAEQFVHYGNEQFNSVPVTRANPDFLDNSITHLNVGYNPSPRVGLNLSVPYIVNSFRRSDVRFFAAGLPKPYTEQATESGIGDLALIGRFTILTQQQMAYDFQVNLLAGVKFPTGDPARLQDEVQQAIIFNSFVPPGIPHDPLEHSLSSVHEHDLARGSGSFDGVFGVTMNARWRRWFFDGQFQYALRTEGESTFQYGDDLLLTAGPGRYLLLSKAWTLSLQAVATYQSMGHDRVFGRTSFVTGEVAWYFGPQLAFTWGPHFRLNAGVDLPVRITNAGFETVPTYRVNGGVSWRF